MTIKQRIIQLKETISVFDYMVKKKMVPWYAKVLMFITIGYALSPIDLIPDFIPILGYLDDLIILPLLILLTLKILPKDSYNQAKEAVEHEVVKPKKKWFHALPIVATWLLIITLIAIKMH